MLKVAIVFTLGCSVLCCNAILSFLDLLLPGAHVQLPHGVIYLEAVLSVLSCSLFLTGSFFSFIETWKLDPQDDPGFASQLQGAGLGEKSLPEELKGIQPNLPGVHLLEGNSSHEQLFKHFQELAPSEKEITKSAETSRRSSIDSSFTPTKVAAPRPSRSRYLELRIFASTIFLASSALYCATSLVSLVTIIHHGTIDRCIRYPQLVAAAGFAIGSLLHIIKHQRDFEGKWWKVPLFHASIQVNFWNLIGSAGFIFCAYFGLLQHASWAQKQFGYSYLWGSWAFMVGSIIEWWRKDRKKDDRKLEKSPV